MKLIIILFVELIKHGLSSSHVCDELAEMSVSDLVTIESEEIFCDHQNICRGIRSGVGELISCDDAFRIVTERNRRELTLPPIMRECSEEDEDWIAQDEARIRLSSGSALKHFTPHVRGLLESFDTTASMITRRISKMYPQLVYSDEVDGTLLRTLTSLVVQVVMAFRPPGSIIGSDDLSDAVRKSDSFREYAWYVMAMLNKISSVPMHEAEIFMASMAPWIHAFMYVQYQIHFWYPKTFEGNTWILLAISKLHPLYDHRDDVLWYLLIPTPSNEVDAEIMFQRNQMVDRVTADDVSRSHIAADLLFDGPAGLSETPGELIRRILHQMEIYLIHIDEPGDLEADQIYDTEEKYSRIIQILVYALECQYEEELVVHGKFSWSSLLKQELLPADFDPWMIYNYIETANWSSAIIVDSTIAALIRLFGSGMPPHMRLSLFTVYNTARRRVCRQAGSQESVLYINPESGLNHTASALMRPNIHELSFISLYSVGHQDERSWEMYIQLLGMFMSTETNDLIIAVPGNTTEYYNTINPLYADDRISEQIALGRLLGIVFKAKLASLILSQLLVGSPTLIRTLFFDSFYVRKGFNDVTIELNIEELFATGFELVEALQAIE